MSLSMPRFPNTPLIFFIFPWLWKQSLGDVALVLEIWNNNNQSPKKLDKILEKDLWRNSFFSFTGVCKAFAQIFSTHFFRSRLLLRLSAVFPYISTDAKTLCTIRVKLFKNSFTVRYFSNFLYNFLTISVLLTMMEKMIRIEQK